MKKTFLLYLISFGCCLPFLIHAKKPLSLVIQGSQISELKIQPSEQWVIEGEASRRNNNETVFIKLKKNSRTVIKTPSKNINVIIRSAERIDLQDFTLEKIKFSLALKKGQIVIQNSHGDFKLSLDEGKVDFTKNQGNLEVHSYSAPIQVTDWKGELNIYSHSGRIRLQQSMGHQNIQCFSSPLHFESSEGSLKFQCEKSNVRFKKYKGNISGYTHSGEVVGSITPQKGEIVTGSGRIHLYFSSSKARVEAQSWEGKVFAPPYFYKDRAGGVYKAYGSIRQRGEEKGHIYLKSHSGNIAIL